MSKAYIITGPTSGIGRATALELAKYGTVILVGRNPEKLGEAPGANGKKEAPGYRAQTLTPPQSSVVWLPQWL